MYIHKYDVGSGNVFYQVSGGKGRSGKTFTLNPEDHKGSTQLTKNAEGIIRAIDEKIKEGVEEEPEKVQKTRSDKTPLEPRRNPREVQYEEVQKTSRVIANFIAASRE